MAAGDPTGSPLASVTIDGDTLTDSFAEVTFTFDTPYAVSSGTKYAIVCTAPSAAGNGNEFDYWIKDGNEYANGANYTSDDTGSTWAENTGYDGWFKTFASGPVYKDTNTPATTIYFQTVADPDIAAIVFTASEDYTMAGVVLKCQRLFTAWPLGNVTIALYATEAAVAKATNPTPANEVTGVTLNQTTLTWDDGGSTDNYDVYYGTDPGDLTLVSSAQAGTSFTITGITNGSPLDYEVTRYWRVDARVGEDVATGDVWSFTTLVFDNPRVTFKLISGGSGNGPYDATPGVEGTDFEYTGENNMITVRRLVAAASNIFWFEDIK